VPPESGRKETFMKVTPNTHPGQLASLVSVAKAFAAVEEIDGHVAALDLKRTAVATSPPADIYKHLVTIYTGVRPLLAAITALPVWPAKWRAALSALVDALDAVSVAVNPDFKAGKDV
jgi:hypothetical protein